MHCVLTIQYRIKFLVAAFVPDRSTLRYSFLNINNLLSFFAYGANFKYNNEEISSVLIRWHDTLPFNIVLLSSRYLSCLVYNSNIFSRREIILTNLLCSQTCSLRSFSRTLSLTYLNLALVWILPTVDTESAAFSTITNTTYVSRRKKKMTQDGFDLFDRHSRVTNKRYFPCDIQYFYTLIVREIL